MISGNLLTRYCTLISMAHLLNMALWYVHWKTMGTMLSTETKRLSKSFTNDISLLNQIFTIYSPVCKSLVSKIQIILMVSKMKIRLTSQIPLNQFTSLASCDTSSTCRGNVGVIGWLGCRGGGAWFLKKLGGHKWGETSIFGAFFMFLVRISASSQ